MNECRCSKIVSWSHAFSNQVAKHLLTSGNFYKKNWPIKEIMTNIINFIIKLASWAHLKKQSSRAQAKSETKGSRQKWTPPIPSTAPKSANPNCCKLNKFQIQNPRVVANSWAAQLSECFISTCCFSHPRSPKTGTDERLGREVKRVFSSMFYIKGIRKEHIVYEFLKYNMWLKNQQCQVILVASAMQLHAMRQTYHCYRPEHHAYHSKAGPEKINVGKYKVYKE